jgi:dihydropyrimidinase
MVDVFATAPAKLYGIFPKKGAILPGADADLLIFDPDYNGKISVATSQEQVDYSLYEGFEQRGRPEKVFLRGRLVVSGGEFVGRKGEGKFISRNPYGMAYSGL